MTSNRPKCILEETQHKEKTNWSSLSLKTARHKFTRTLKRQSNFLPPDALSQCKHDPYPKNLGRYIPAHCGQSDTHGDRCCQWSSPGRYRTRLSGSRWLSRSTTEPRWTWSCRHSWELLYFLQRDHTQGSISIKYSSSFELLRCIHSALLSETLMDPAFPIHWPDARGW